MQQGLRRLIIVATAVYAAVAVLTALRGAEEIRRYDLMGRVLGHYRGPMDPSSLGRLASTDFDQTLAATLVGWAIVYVLAWLSYMAGRWVWLGFKSAPT